MKVVLAGGSGLIGSLLQDSFKKSVDEVIVLSRSSRNGAVTWDGKTLGPWVKQFDGADVVINLVGRSINCRLTDENRRQLLDSRVDSTRVIGQAIATCDNPPATWLQASAANLYTHRLDTANDEYTGVIGGNEPDLPERWRFGIELVKQWEAALEQAKTPTTRKIAMRITLVMTPQRESVFDILSKLVRMRLGGPLAGGRQYVSWIHEVDFVQAVKFLIDRTEISGPVNMVAPDPLPQKELMRVLRAVQGVRIGLPATRWMAEIGAFVMRTESELILKSRRVIPGVLHRHGFDFKFPDWQSAARELTKRWRGG